MPARTRRYSHREVDAADGRPREITDVLPDSRAPGYLIIEVDGARFASLPAEIVVSLGIRTGEQLDQERFATLTRIADVEAAHQVAMRLLANRPRAVKDMLRQLRNRGHNPSAAAAAVGRLEANGLLNDLEFARHFTRVRSGKGHGPLRLISDLLARGVEKRLAERAVYETIEAEDIDPQAQARALAAKRSGQLGDLPPETKRRRLLAYLGRRGFRGYEIDEMVRSLLPPPSSLGRGE